MGGNSKPPFKKNKNDIWAYFVNLNFFGGLTFVIVFKRQLETLPYSKHLFLKATYVLAQANFTEGFCFEF